MSTVQRHLSFLDSELVAASVARSTFAVHDLLKRAVTVYLQIPPDQLEAQRGLLRCWLSTLIRGLGKAGDERKGEVLCLLDEASALGGLPAVEEALVRGRSAGVRLLLAYQSDSSVQAAFKDKPTLIYDNCSVQLYLGVSSIESAERISKSLGEWTQVLESYGENAGCSWTEWGPSSGQGPQRNQGRNVTYSVNGRALLRPDEILRLSGDMLIAFVRGIPPILARRIKWYKDPDFASGGVLGLGKVVWSVLLATAVAVVAWALLGG